MPTIISFYGGADYYYKAADRLRAACDHHGLAHYIEEMTIGENENWSDICRKKIEFMYRKLEELESPIFWIDVDSILLKKPNFLNDNTADVGAFLRNFKALTRFDPVTAARILHPGYLYFSYTGAARKMLRTALDKSQVFEGEATDDYFLHEAYLEHGDEIRLLIFSERDMCKSEEDPRYETACFMHQSSGNVSTFIKTAAQHEPAAFAVARQSNILQAFASINARHGRTGEALVFLKNIIRISPDANTYKRLLTLQEKQGNENKLQFHIQKGKKHPVLAFEAWRFQLERAIKRDIEDKQSKHAPRVFKEIEAQGDDKTRALARSRLFRYEFEREAWRKSIEDGDRIRLWWMQTPYPGNFGDLLGPYVIHKLFGAPPIYAAASNRLLAIGSIIKFAKPGDIVWGAGTSRREVELSDKATYAAVRGPLTRELVLSAGGKCPEIYGDAAWLLPKLYSPSVEKRHALGVVLHNQHANAEIPLGDGVVDIPIIRSSYREIEAFIREILSCEAILTTSLHGVIVANAYGVPVKWCTLTSSGRQIHGDGIKFEDYFQSIGRSGIEPLDLAGFGVLEEKLTSQCTDFPEQDIDIEELEGALRGALDENPAVYDVKKPKPARKRFSLASLISRWS